MDDWERLRLALDEAGVSGSEDLGYFVSNTEHFRASALDERAAMPVLLRMLPSLSDRRAVRAVAGHLRRPWARPTAFDALASSFPEWALHDANVGWALGDALATSARVEHLTTLLQLATDRRYGAARQMIVMSLWRFKGDERVAATLVRLIHDPEVTLHAMSALRRTVGNGEALEHLRLVRDDHEDPKVRAQAAKQVRQAEKAAAR
jgi:hypothetical protein